ncbi:hypothetical protein F5Y19DRAFT_479576 [Xylariaceae sp. FL1651]|nr:hypothetical protein F5Y19DRAFT_479576 [Xylariaceae sp. FL1651]
MRPRHRAAGVWACRKCSCISYIAVLPSPVASQSSPASPLSSTCRKDEAKRAPFLRPLRPQPSKKAFAGAHRNGNHSRVVSSRSVRTIHEECYSLFHLRLLHHFEKIVAEDMGSYYPGMDRLVAMLGRSVYTITRPQINETRLLMFVFSSLLGHHILSDVASRLTAIDDGDTELGGVIESLVASIVVHRGLGAITWEAWGLFDDDTC